jgi:GNAT superfamily N-acetyltransferase
MKTVQIVLFSNQKYRKQGIGSSLLRFAESRLSKIGCIKINLQILEGNETVENFYPSNGFLSEKRISMGKIINHNKTR